ncbi:glycosyltransferase family 2 protein [Dyadobacter frigoris]|nr:glycosyltransferase [Dyadobacter frigoris]
MSEPKITVLMPAYNAGKFIGEAIRSVLGQSFSDFELLIVNDGSTDGTLSVIQTFDDERITVINQANKGIAAALNIGLRYAKAFYIARFDADDICYPDRLKIQYEFITSNPDFSIVGSGADYVDLYGNYVFTHQPDGFTNAQIQQLSYKICPFIHSGVLYKKETILGYGGYNERAYTYEDHFLWANILKNEKVCNLAQPLIKVRLNPDSVTIDEKWRTNTFRSIKYSTLKKCFISKNEGLKLLEIGKKQHSHRIKEGAYYALLGKKYLWNNYQPQKARTNLLKTLSISPFHVKNYFLLLLSFLPEKALTSFYKAVKISAANNTILPNNPLTERKELLDYDR